MKTFKAKILVRLKPNVPDNRGELLKQAIESMFQVENLTTRIGSCYMFKFDANSHLEALNLLNSVASELLINEFSEEYEIRSIDEVIGID